MSNPDHIPDAHRYCFLNVLTDGGLGSFEMFLQFSLLDTLHPKGAYIGNVFSDTRLVSSCAHPRCSPSIPAMFPVLYLGRNIPT
jgi:hypothetical protein